MSMDQNLHQRTVYSLLDLLGDVGGLIDCLNIIGTFVVWIFTGNRLTEFMVTRLFLIDKRSRKENDQDNGDNKATLESIKKRKKLKESSFPSPFCFWQKKRKLIEMANMRIEKELDVLNYFRKLKKLELLLSIIFTKQERFLLNKQRCFTVSKCQLEKNESSSIDEKN